MFILVDERIYTNRHHSYIITDANFDDNKARSGGGVFVGSSKTVVDGQSVNARRFLVRIEDSRFFQNW